MSEFNLINMNGRVYDPWLGRMLSPDNYVQAAGYSQNYNRYSYAYNNPLKYTDPNGEYAMMFFGLAFTGDFVSNVINGVHDPLGTAYNNALNTTNGINNCAQVSIYQDGNTTLTAGIDPFAFGVSANLRHTQGDFTLHASVGFSMLNGGFTANAGLSYNDDSWRIAINGGIGKNYKALGGSIAYNGYGLGYHKTSYGDAPGPDNISNEQIVGGYTLYFNNNSFRIENDYWGDKHDRWRSSAWEITIGDYSVGSTIYNNDPKGEDPTNFDLNGKNRLGKTNRLVNGKQKYGAWKNGKVYSSPLYFGVRIGNTIDRIGFNSPWVQEFTQNVIHRWAPFGRQNFYTNDKDFQHGIYMHGGYYSPYSLY